MNKAATVGSDVEVRLAERLALKGRLDERGTRRAERLLKHLAATPMSVILERVPGQSVKQKADRLGVSKATYYYWLAGATRPNDIQARKIKRLTGYDYEVIRGLA
jgi:hypothetical protein